DASLTRVAKGSTAEQKRQTGTVDNLVSDAACGGRFDQPRTERQPPKTHGGTRNQGSRKTKDSGASATIQIPDPGPRIRNGRQKAKKPAEASAITVSVESPEPPEPIELAGRKRKRPEDIDSQVNAVGTRTSP